MHFLQNCSKSSGAPLLSCYKFNINPSLSGKFGRYIRFDQQNSPPAVYRRFIGMCLHYSRMVSRLSTRKNSQIFTAVCLKSFLQRATNARFKESFAFVHFFAGYISYKECRRLPILCIPNKGIIFLYEQKEKPSYQSPSTDKTVFFKHLLSKHPLSKYLPSKLLRPKNYSTRKSLTSLSEYIH